MAALNQTGLNGSWPPGFVRVSGGARPVTPVRDVLDQIVPTLARV
jgi:hypothetical protein